MDKKQKRIENLFNKKTGKAVIIPMDHGIGGTVEGLMDPIESMKRFISLGADALLVNFGILKLTVDYLHDLEEPPGIIMGVDVNVGWPGWKKAVEGEGFIGHLNSASIESAEKYGADAVKVLWPLGVGPDLTLRYYEDITKVIQEADKYDMPVMVEPVTLGNYIADDRRNDANIIADGCRISLEIGADILKAPFPGPEGQDIFAGICSNSHVPVVMLGGAKKDGLKGVMETARLGIDAGSKGTIFGRNVWQRPVEEMKKVVNALQDIVHKDASVDDVMKKYNL